MPRLLAPILAVIAALSAPTAAAGCGGLSGETLRQCQEAQAQMQRAYFRQQEEMNAEVLTFRAGNTQLRYSRSELGADPGNQFSPTPYEVVCAKWKGTGRVSGPGLSFGCSRGRLHGVMEARDERGKALYRGRFDHGVKRGVHVRFAKDGARTEHHHLDARRVRMINYDAGGAAIRQTESLDGQPHGLFFEVTNGRRFETRYFRGRRTDLPPR